MQNTIIFITGRKGSGKSTAAQKIALTVYESGRRVVILDPMNCFDLPGVPRIHTAQEITRDLWGRSFIGLPGQQERMPESFFKWAYICGDLTLVVDEIDLYLGHANPSPSLLNVIRYGRHRQINLVAISQRPANVMRDLTAQSDYLVMFQTAEPRDLEYLTGRIGREQAEQVQNLSNFRSLVYSAETGNVSEMEVTL